MDIWREVNMLKEKKEEDIRLKQEGCHSVDRGDE